MPLRFLIDENLRGRLLQAIAKRNFNSEFPIDAFQVGDSDCPELGTLDIDLLKWAALNGRVVLSRDRETLTSDFNAFIQDGTSHPGLIILRRGCTIPEIVDFLEIVSAVGQSEDFADVIRFGPF